MENKYTINFYVVYEDSLFMYHQHTSSIKYELPDLTPPIWTTDMNKDPPVECLMNVIQIKETEFVADIYMEMKPMITRLKNDLSTLSGSFN